MYEIEVIWVPVTDDDPTPFYAVARSRETGCIVRMGPDAETEDRARDALREIMEEK